MLRLERAHRHVLGCLLALLFSALDGAGVSQPPVVVSAEYKVKDGKLWVEPKTDQSTDQDLISLYGTKDLANAFKAQVFQEVKASLDVLNPIVDWKAVTNADGTPIDMTKLISSEDLPRAKAFSGSLKDWLTQFLTDGNDAGTFFSWRPTRLSRIEEDSDKEVIEEAVSVVLSRSAANLIARISETEVAETDYRRGILKLRFSEARPVTKVTIAGMDWPNELSAVESADYGQQKQSFQNELFAVSHDIGLAWNDDLAVQRMMIVLRARGLWNGFAQAEPGSPPRAIHWLSFVTNSEGQAEVEVHVPHLAYLIFQPAPPGMSARFAATNDSVIVAVARELLSDKQRNVLEESLAAQNEPNGKKMFLKRIVKTREDLLPGARFIDLFALNSFLGKQMAGKIDPITREETEKKAVRVPPIPVKESWLAPRLERIRDSGWYVAAEPSPKAENRIDESSNAKRNSNLSGGIDIWISPPRPTDATDTVTTTNQTAPDTNVPSFKDWLLNTVKYRIEAGARLEDGQPIDWSTRFSATHTATFGSFDSELRYQYRLSARLDWELPNSKDTLLPSYISAFTDSAARRKVDGQEIEIQRQGIRISKQKSFDNLDWMPRLDAAVELAKVHDIADSQPDADELHLPLALSLFSEPNLWDAREYLNLRLSAVPSVRWQSDSDFWVLTGAAARIRRPHGYWDYVCSLDARWAIGDAPPDALPWVGGIEGVRGVRPYGAPARGRVVMRNELWLQVPLFARNTGSDQHWYALAYENLRVAGFIDAAWASEIHESVPTDPWFFSPGVGVRLMLTRTTYLSFDYAYGICRPSNLGGHRFSLGIAAQL